MAAKVHGNRLPVAKPRAIVAAVGARVWVIAPRMGQRVGRAFVVRVRVSGFSLQGPGAGGLSLAGHGHLAFALDGGRFDEPRFSGVNGRWALQQAVNGYYSPAYGPSIVYRRVPAGRHRLVVSLVNRDGSPAGVSSDVSFSVR
jgi:hypothetical protein